MNRSEIIAAFVAIAATGAAAAAPTVSTAVDPRAARVVELTRQTRTTYAVYTWNVITPRGQPLFEEWSAEFHSGSLHRVETPRDRIVADCKAMAGTHLDIASGKIDKGEQVAAVACGVARTLPVLELTYLRTETSPWGKADRIRLRDAATIRSYAINARGIIVAQTISDPDGGRRLTMKARAIRNSVPKDAFSVASLQRSLVDEQFKLAPTG